MKEAKPVGWRGFFNAEGQGRFITRTRTRAAVERGIGYRINPNNDCYCETGNIEELSALDSAPDGAIMWQPYKTRKPFRVVGWQA